MATVLPDILDGTLERTAQGWRHERVFRVVDVAGDGAARFYNAVMTTGIPLHGEFHPFIPGIIVLRATASTEDGSIFTVMVEYGVPTVDALPADPAAPPQAEIGTTLTSTTTAVDANGNPILIPSWTRLVESDSDGDGINDTTTPQTLPGQGGELSNFEPMSVIQLTRRETIFALDLFRKSRYYVGSVNATPIWDSEARSLLCTQITGQSIDGGTTYNVTYGFQYNGRYLGNLFVGWDGVAVYRDPETGEAADQAAVGSGILAPVPLKRATEFANLQL